MATLKYNSTQIRTAANKINAETEKIQSNLVKLDELCSSVQTSWQDASANKYIEKFDEKKQNIGVLTQELANLAKILNNCANSIDTNRQNAIDNGGKL